MCGCLGKPVTWSTFKILSYLYQLKVYELRMKTQFKLYDNISIQLQFLVTKLTEVSVKFYFKGWSVAD
jgi:hypothetical protein